MKGMLKLIIVLALGFASTFFILTLSGVLSVERITTWLTMAQQSSPLVIGTVVTLLLFADLFVAMPTLTIMLLSGFFLGPLIGTIFTILGVSLAGFTGYALSERYGDRLVKKLIPDQAERQQAVNSFCRFGVGTILLSRAMPILPEVSACMAGLKQMSRSKFALAWLGSVVPYAVIANYAGSISSLSNPKPAIFTAIGLTLTFWTGWAVYRSTLGNPQSTAFAAIIK